MRFFYLPFVGASGILLAATTFVLLLTQGLLSPPASDLRSLALFLIVSGGVTVALSFAIARVGVPRRVASFRARLVLVSTLTAALALVNVGFTSFLMFLSPHDLALLVGLLGFSLALAIYVAITISQPTAQAVQSLVAAAGRMSTGDLDTRVTVQSHDEIEEVARAFNAMAEQIERSVVRAHDLEQTRKELISAVSHDLRTPLASIRVMVESMSDGVVDDAETIERYLRITLSEVEHLSQLVNDLFDLSQVDSGALEMHMESASVQDLISDTLEAMSVQATANRLVLHGSVDGLLVPVVMDTQRIQRVLYNLVQNAMRHTPPDGTIDIRASDKGAEVQVEVVDTGEGIAETDLRRLFERWYRPDQSRSRSSGGTGLGLSIAKGIVEAHGGRIWAESVMGKGSTFRFTLPKNAVS